jgi:hypothetical protein
MSGDWVNRIGIILNFCAGFLLAPELIGIERLQRFEKFLEERVERAQNSVLDLSLLGEVMLTVGIGIGHGFLRAFGAFVSVSSVILWAVFLYATLFVFQLSVQEIAVLVICAVAIPFVALYVSALMRQRQTLRVIKGISRVILVVEFGFLLIPLALLGRAAWESLVSNGFAFGGLLLFRLLNSILVRLTGNDRLRGVVVFAGIAVFIVGNALQLWATWLSDSRK